MAAKDERGRAGEKRAAEHLCAAGYTILDRNWRCAHGEVDIVAARDTDLVVVEVKTRRTGRFGHPFDAVDSGKRARLWRVCHAWRAAHPEHARARRPRLDVIGILGERPEDAELEHWTDLQ
ncbi:YraN family protein [Microbacterium sp.]|uniref:YraN family protein n=1 Tax=Microbacterium sp. TaxID=51671 RepID=UPI003A8BE77C